MPKCERSDRTRMARVVTLAVVSQEDNKGVSREGDKAVANKAEDFKVVGNREEGFKVVDSREEDFKGVDSRVVDFKAAAASRAVGATAAAEEVGVEGEAEAEGVAEEEAEEDNVSFSTILRSFVSIRFVSCFYVDPHWALRSMRLEYRIGRIYSAEGATLWLLYSLFQAAHVTEVRQDLPARQAKRGIQVKTASLVNQDLLVNQRHPERARNPCARRQPAIPALQDLLVRRVLLEIPGRMDQRVRIHSSISQDYLDYRAIVGTTALQGLPARKAHPVHLDKCCKVQLPTDHPESLGRWGNPGSQELQECRQTQCLGHLVPPVTPAGQVNQVNLV